MLNYIRKKTKVFHDNHIIRKSFIVGQKVILYNSRLHLFLEKLRSRWSGPYEVTHVSPYGEIEVRNLSNGSIFKVNGQRLKPYLEGVKNLGETLMLLRTPEDSP